MFAGFLSIHFKLKARIISIGEVLRTILTPRLLMPSFSGRKNSAKRCNIFKS
jgi:hypothetical protein